MYHICSNNIENKEHKGKKKKIRNRKEEIQLCELLTVTAAIRMATDAEFSLDTESCGK